MHRWAEAALPTMPKSADVRMVVDEAFDKGRAFEAAIREAVPHEPKCVDCGGGEWVAHTTCNRRLHDTMASCGRSHHSFNPAAQPAEANREYSESPEMVSARDSLTIYYHSYGCPSRPPDNGTCSCGLTDFVDEALQAAFKHGAERPAEANLLADLLALVREPHVLRLCDEAECHEFGTWTAFDGESMCYLCEQHATAKPDWWNDEEDGDWRPTYEPDERLIAIVAAINRASGAALSRQPTEGRTP